MRQCRKQVLEGVGGDRDHRQRRGRLGWRARWHQEPRVCRVSARRGGFSPADLRAPACRSEEAVGATDPAPENHRRETSVSSSLLPCSLHPLGSSLLGNFITSFLPTTFLFFLSSSVFSFPLTLTWPFYVSDMMVAAKGTFYNVFRVKMLLFLRGCKSLHKTKWEDKSVCLYTLSF